MKAAGNGGRFINEHSNNRPYKAMKHTTEQKYEYLLSLLQVQDVDRYEQDALLTMPEVYFQFSVDDDLQDKDNIVELCMSDWYRKHYEQKEAWEACCKECGIVYEEN